MPIHVVTRDGGILVDANRAFFEAFDYDPEEVMGRPMEEMGLWIEAAHRKAVVQEVRARGEVPGRRDSSADP